MPSRIAPRLAALALLPLLAAGCASRPLPPIVWRGPLGEVRAYEAAQGARMVEYITDLAPRVLELVPSTELEPLDVRVLRADQLAYGRGSTFRAHMEFGPCRGELIERLVVAHELVHWSLRGAWRHLPAVVEEGLADHVAGALVPEALPHRHLDYIFAMRRLMRGEPPDVLATLALDHAGLERVADEVERSALYSLGYVIARAIGVEGLHALCERARAAGHARVPPEWLAEAAALGALDASTWYRSVRRLYGPEERRLLTGDGAPGPR
jgi:hypothetical protein